MAQAVGAIDADQDPTLPNPPLVEAFFEIRWALDTGPGGTLRDAGYALAAGRFFSEVKNQFGFVEQLPAAAIPDALTGYMIKQRFRVGDGRWPLVQIGPGIASINFTQPYSWPSFRDAILSFVPKITEAYAGISPWKPTSLSMRYIDAWEYDHRSNDAVKFLTQMMHTDLHLPGAIENDPDRDGAPIGFTLSVGLPLKNPKGSATIQVAAGEKSNKPAIIWDLTVNSLDDVAAAAVNQLPAWLDASHAVVHRWFKALTEGELYANFQKQTS